MICKTLLPTHPTPSSTPLHHGNRLFFTNSVSARRNQFPDPLPDTGFVLLAGQTNACMGACWHPAITFPIKTPSYSARRSCTWLGTKPNHTFTSRFKLTRIGSKKTLEGKTLVCTILPSDSRLECLHSWWSSGRRGRGRSSPVYSYTWNRHSR